ncbi:MAG: hypothetical protein U0R17_00985 [Acidimicrobiia bacterium]
MFIKVLPDLKKIENSYWFKLDDKENNIGIGTIVKINLHNRKLKGWVIAITQNDSDLLEDGLSLETIAALKYIETIHSCGPPEYLIDICFKLSQYYLCSPVVFLRYCSPKNKLNAKLKSRKPKSNPDFKRQLIVVDPRADRRPYVEDLISKEGSTLIIAPDSHQKFISWLQGLGHNVTGYSYGDKTKNENYFAVSQKDKIIVGSRAALFAPIDNLQSIILLDDTYEQLQEGRSPKYRAIDVAKLYSQIFKIDLTVISCVPGVSTFDFEIIDKRDVDNWPQIYIENKSKLDPSFGTFSPKIISSVNKVLDNKKDVAFIVNNKSISKMLICTKCEQIARCENCDHSVESDTENEFICKFCNTVRPAICLNCRSTNFKKYRKGIKALKIECEKLFSKANVVEVTKETHDQKLNENTPNVIVGSEALLHDISFTKNMSLAVFIDFDALMYRPSISAFESCLVLLSRVLRKLKPIKNFECVIISTNSYNSTLIADIQKKDFVAQRDRELTLRKSLKLFPYFANAELTCDPVALNKLKPILDPNLVTGTIQDDIVKIFLTAENHDILANSCYEHIRSFSVNNKCLVSIDDFD